MSKNYYNDGASDALHYLGLTKTAAPRVTMMAGPSIFRRALNWAKAKRPTWRGTREMMFGQPIEFARQLRSGRAFRKGGLARESMRAKTLLDKAFLWGFPAYEGYQVLTDPAMDKARGMGGVLGSALLLNATWRPLGLVGSGIAGMAGARLGRGIGSAVGGSTDKQTLPQPPQQI